MGNLPERKVGIIACSGEEIAEGTVSRLAALKVLHDLRRGRTVTICLPLFLAGGEGDRAFARFHPTITVDGCDVRCAARGTEMYSGTPTASVVVSDLAGRGRCAGTVRASIPRRGRRQAVNLTAERLAQLVDEVLQPGGSETTAAGAPVAAGAIPPVTCSCGSGIPVARVTIQGREVELLALPLIFSQVREAGARPDDEASIGKLMETVKIYNEVPAGRRTGLPRGDPREYREFCAREANR